MSNLVSFVLQSQQEEGTASIEVYERLLESISSEFSRLKKLQQNSSSSNSSNLKNLTLDFFKIFSKSAIEKRKASSSWRCATPLPKIIVDTFSDFSKEICQDEETSMLLLRLFLTDDCFFDLSSNINNLETTMISSSDTPELKLDFKQIVRCIVDTSRNPSSCFRCLFDYDSSATNTNTSSYNENARNLSTSSSSSTTSSSIKAIQTFVNEILFGESCCFFVHGSLFLLWKNQQQQQNQNPVETKNPFIFLSNERDETQRRRGKRVESCLQQPQQQSFQQQQEKSSVWCRILNFHPTITKTNQNFQGYTSSSFSSSPLDARIFLSSSLAFRFLLQVATSTLLSTSSSSSVSSNQQQQQQQQQNINKNFIIFVENPEVRFRFLEWLSSSSTSPCTNDNNMTMDPDIRIDMKHAVLGLLLLHPLVYNSQQNINNNNNLRQQQQQEMCWFCQSAFQHQITVNNSSIDLVCVATSSTDVVGDHHRQKKRNFLFAQVPFFEEKDENQNQNQNQNSNIQKPILPEFTLVALSSPISLLFLLNRSFGEKFCDISDPFCLSSGCWLIRVLLDLLIKSDIENENKEKLADGAKATTNIMSFNLNFDFCENIVKLMIEMISEIRSNCFSGCFQNSDDYISTSTSATTNSNSNEFQNQWKDFVLDQKQRNLFGTVKLVETLEHFVFCYLILSEKQQQQQNFAEQEQEEEEKEYSGSKISWKPSTTSSDFVQSFFVVDDDESENINNNSNSNNNVVIVTALQDLLRLASKSVEVFELNFDRKFVSDLSGYYV